MKYLLDLPKLTYKVSTQSLVHIHPQPNPARPTHQAEDKDHSQDSGMTSLLGSPRKVETTMLD